MIRVAVEGRRHAVVHRVGFTAESIEQALELRGENARSVLPTGADSFLAPGDAAELVEEQSIMASKFRAWLAA